MQRFRLMLVLLLAATVVRAETNQTGPLATPDQVALSLCQDPSGAVQAPDGKGASSARKQGLTHVGAAPLRLEELNEVHGRNLMSGASVQPLLQRSDVKLWDEGRAVLRPQQSH